MLTHYTRDLATLVKILTNGFGWFPNRKNLMPLLVPQHDFSLREPQHFGMISFTEISPEVSAKHRRVFGNYGICISADWARRNNAERVIYVEDTGPGTEAWRSLFLAGYREVKSHLTNPDDALLAMAYENKSVAGVSGATLWASLLQLYEYMEPAINSHQREWRIANPNPDYSLDKPKQELIKSISPPKGWAAHLNVVKFASSDVLSIICPKSEFGNTQSALPPNYKGVSIIQVD